MEEKKLDLRIQKTYKALCDTFLIMLSEKRFEDITVNELCERAMVRRATFYKHFADKYEFFGFFVRQIQDNFNAQSQDFAEDNAPHSYYIFLFRESIRFFNHHEKLVKSVLKSNMFPALVEILSDEIYRNVLYKLKEDAKRGVVFSISPEIMASFYTGGIIHTLCLWYTTPRNRSEEELIEEVRKMLCSFQPPVSE